MKEVKPEEKIIFRDVYKKSNRESDSEGRRLNYLVSSRFSTDRDTQTAAQLHHTQVESRGAAQKVKIQQQKNEKLN